MKLLIRILLGICTAILIACLAVTVLYRTIPQTNTGLRHFDALIVLGNPANPDGTAAPEQRARVMEAVREYRLNAAPYIIMSGGAAHNRYVEAHVMALLARENGVPLGNIIEETQALNTIQNAFYSVAIMRSRHWHSAEIISSPSHLPRAGLIFQRFPIEWRMHAAPWPESYSVFQSGALYVAESLYCSKLRILGLPQTLFLSGLIN